MERISKVPSFYSFLYLNFNFKNSEGRRAYYTCVLDTSSSNVNYDQFIMDVSYLVRSILFICIFQC